MKNDTEEKDELEYQKDTPMASYWQLYQFSSTRIKFWLVLGIIGAMIAGWSMPLFVIFIQDLYNSFDPDTGKKEVYGKRS